MDTQINKIQLENGLMIYVYDHTRRYYGDFYRVKIEIVCEVPLKEEYFENGHDFAEAQNILGNSVFYRRYMEKMGVPSTGIERVKEILVENFREHSMPYFLSENFPARFVLSNCGKSKKSFGRKAAR